MRVSLAGVAKWIRSLGQIDLQDVDKLSLSLPRDVFDEEIKKFSVELTPVLSDKAVNLDEERPSRIKAIRHAAHFSLTPVKEKDAPLTLDVHKASWIERN